MLARWSAIFSLLVTPQWILAQFSPDEVGRWNESALETTNSSQRATYPYRMKGRVRLLFFWVGKADVGGGNIAIEQVRPTPGVVQEKIEVLFGSFPDRVPGKINRWGYGREAAEWHPNGSGKPSLVQTVFEGYMKHSDEESIADARASAETGNGEEAVWYDGIRSTVLPEEAISEIRYFSEESDFDFRRPEAVHCGYQKRLDFGPADKKRRIGNQTGSYREPFGFLTAVRSLLLNSLEVDGSPSGDPRQLTYVYNAKTYRLMVRRVKVLKKFNLPLGGDEKEQKRPFSGVAKVDFRLVRLDDNDKHDFSIWSPRSGSLAGVPLRIVDKPRWWLQVELDLDLNRLEAGKAAYTSPSQVDCSIQQDRAPQFSGD